MPPLHPNCRCSLVAPDRDTAWLYNSPKGAEMLRQLSSALNELGGGGIFTLDSRFRTFGISPKTLTRLNLGTEMIVSVIDPRMQVASREFARLLEGSGRLLQELGEDVSSNFSKIVTSSLILPDAFLQDGERRWADALEAAEGNPLLAVCFVTGLAASDLLNAVGAELAYRWSAFLREPGLITGINLLALGLADAVYGMLFPEELFSPEHLMDIFGVALAASALRVSGHALARGVSSADDFVRGILDDLTRGSASGLTRRQIDVILRAGKGNRPDPSTYLRASYIDEHLAQFQNGVTKFNAQSPSGRAGPDGGTYVMPSSLADDVLRRAGGDVSKLEELLGLSPGDLGVQPVRIDVSNPTGLRMPSGNEFGTNPQWRPGGYTSGGIMEAVIDPPSLGQYVVNPIW